MPWAQSSPSTRLSEAWGRKSWSTTRTGRRRCTRFLPDAGVIVNRLGPLDGFDAVFVLDCSEIERAGEEAPRIAGIRQIINIDHHISNDQYGNLTLTDPEASSTGEMIFRLIDGMGLEITKDMAVNLYTAILTDTGAFRYSNTGPKTFAAAGRLLEKGADPAWIAQMVYETFPAAKIRLLSRALSTLEFDWQGRIAAAHRVEENARRDGRTVGTHGRVRRIPPLHRGRAGGRLLQRDGRGNL